MASADDLLAEHGQTFADEVGIDVAKNTPAPLHGLLVLTQLLSANLQHELGIRAARELKRSRLLSAQRIVDAGEKKVWDALSRGKYLRKERTADMLVAAAEHSLDAYGGDLRRLRQEADGDVGRAAELVQEFKGIGATGAEIFLREVQVAWTELGPYFGKRAKEAARNRGLPSSNDALAKLGGAGGAASLGAALIRASLGD